MSRAYVVGLSAWAPGMPDLRSFVRGEMSAEVTDPACEWVPSRLMRGGSRLTKMLGEAAAQACAHGGLDPRTVATFYASGYGEIETMVILLDTIFRGDGQLSPMRFKNSVHNAAAGLCSIGQQNQGFSTALAAGDRSFEAAMVEALTYLGARGGDAVISLADDSLPEPLVALDRRASLAIGVALSSERPANGALAVVELAGHVEGETARPVSLAGRAVSAELALSPSAAALTFVDAVLAKREGRVPLGWSRRGLRGQLAPPLGVLVRPDVREAMDS